MKTVTRIFGSMLPGVFIIIASALNAQEISRKCGRVTIRHENGEKSATGRVSNFQKNGTWKYWDKQGVLHHTATYCHDTLHGMYIEYDADHSVLVYGNYQRGLKNGLWRYYYPDGSPAAENTYQLGQLNGRQVAWYENGNVREIMFCDSDKLISRKVWYPGGQLKTVESYRNGLSDGKWIIYPDPLVSTDTTPAIVDEYSEGKLNGWHLAFRNGKKMEEVFYTSGDANGSCSRWDEHGHLVSVEEFAMGKRNGHCRYYDCNGLLRDVVYENGIQTGPQVDFDRAGDTLSVTWFTDAIRDSVKTFHPNGITATRRAYAYTPGNVEHSEYTEWDARGVKLLYGRYIGELKYGEWYTYYPSGSKKSLTTYVGGIICGPYIKWYENGNRMLEFTVLENGTHTPALVWTEKGRPMKPGTSMYNGIVESAKPGETYIEPVVERASINKHLAEVAPPQLQLEAVETPPVAETVIPEDNRIYMNPDVLPSFPGGEISMQDFIDRNLVHPARLFNVQGTVFISYIVEKDGTVSDVRSVQDVKGAPEFTTEALRVVKKFPKMNPGMRNGEAVRCKVIVPIQFNVR